MFVRKCVEFNITAQSGPVVPNSQLLQFLPLPAMGDQWLIIMWSRKPPTRHMYQRRYTLPPALSVTFRRPALPSPLCDCRLVGSDQHRSTVEYDIFPSKFSVSARHISLASIFLWRVLAHHTSLPPPPIFRSCSCLPPFPFLDFDTATLRMRRVRSGRRSCARCCW